LRIPSVDALRARRVGVELGIGELLLELVVLSQERLHGLEHGQSWPPGMDFCTRSRNSAFEEVSLSLPSTFSSAACVSRPARARRSFQVTLTSSAPSSISSRRVPDALTSRAGKIRLSASCRDRRSSMLPVPLNSSKITSSIFDPAS